ncbi:hypothetical protein QCA50_014065 [Cerrena zonata]|uniref:Uncharacterized protein n=1 Tax=Cerrena zonata TaxID=2478898 RepID=A0AAW0FTQ0_9APHY
MEQFPPVTSVVGGFIEGIGIANMFFGISVSQAYVYYKQWDRDPVWMKCLAATVILLETCNTVFVQRQQYFYSVLAIENPLLLLRIDWSIPVCVHSFVYMDFDLVSDDPCRPQLLLEWSWRLLYKDSMFIECGSSPETSALQLRRLSYFSAVTPSSYF